MRGGSGGQRAAVLATLGRMGGIVPLGPLAWTIRTAVSERARRLSGALEEPEPAPEDEDEDEEPAAPDDERGA